MIVIYDRLIAIVRPRKRDLSDVSNCPETSRPNERTNAWNSRARRVAIRPFRRARRGAAGPRVVRWMFI